MAMPFCRNAAAVLILMGLIGHAGAETKSTDMYGKELKIEPSRNLFARFGLLGFKMNNKSEATKDVSGPVLSRPANTTTPTAGDRGWYCRRGVDPSDPEGERLLPYCDPAGPPAQTIYSGTGGVRNIIFGTPGTANDTGLDSLGLPDNVKARIADPAPGAVGTVGMYFDEEHKWAVEVPVMALPFSIDIYGAGSFQQAGKIITGKALGFFVFGHYYFGEKNSKFRPSISLTANYLAPFDLEATSELERWTGGRTKISSKASFGLGWLVGGKYAINDRWDLNFNVGQFKSTVDSTLTTYDTIFKGNSNPATGSPIFQYWPGVLGDNLRNARDNQGGLLQTQLEAMIAYRNSDPANRVNGGANLGNFTRTQRQTLDPYIMLMTVGYNF
jgi:outer membrane protein W